MGASQNVCLWNRVFADIRGRNHRGSSRSIPPHVQDLSQSTMMVGSASLSLMSKNQNLIDRGMVPSIWYQAKKRVLIH